MTELEALRRVAEAARKWRIAYAREEEGWDYCEDAVDERLDLEEAVLALDALPTPQPTPARSRLAALEALRTAVWDYDRGTGRGGLRWSDVRAALAAVDDSPASAPEPEGEVVEVAVWRDNDDGEVVFCIPKTERDGPLQGWTRLGTTRLALVPEVVGEVG